MLKSSARLSAAAVVMAALALGGPLSAAERQVRVEGPEGPLADAVVSLHAAPARAAADAAATMDQRNTAFEPGVLVIQAGTAVAFPNSDTVQHQVYSFSAAKPFELPLYAGTPPDPIVFDTPGVVVVGCNIHDWMIGHIVVLDTPYFAKTGADGRARLEAPPGRYQLRTWHARAQGAGLGQEIELPADAAPDLVVRLDLAPPPPDRRGSDRLRALQERLRRVDPGQ